jgi:hypothetical protein
MVHIRRRERRLKTKGKTNSENRIINLLFVNRMQSLYCLKLGKDERTKRKRLEYKKEW